MLSMVEGIREVLERTRERIGGPREVAFANGLRIAAFVNSSDPTITLNSGKQVLLDLKSFSSEGTVVRFDPKGKWSVSLGDANNPPILTVGKFKGVNAILDFLHECGHLHDVVSTDLALDADRTYTEKYFRKGPDDHSPERFLTLFERNNTILRAERNAWAFALKNTRHLKEQFGVDIISQMGGVNGVRHYVNSCLSLYEKLTMTELKYLGFEVYSKKEMEELLVKKGGSI